MKILFPCAEFPTAFCLIKAVLTVLYKTLNVILNEREGSAVEIC